jgi:hypothetical protein
LRRLSADLFSLDQRGHPHEDLVADGADALERLVPRILQRPVVAADTRHTGALVAASFSTVS